MIFIIILILLGITIYSTYRAYKIKQEVKEINKDIEEENEKIEQRHY
jgi:cell division protein FtsL